MTNQTVTVYLILNDVNGFIDFTEKIFGAIVNEKHGDEAGNIRHAEIAIGNSAIMIGGANDQWGIQGAGLFVNVTNADASYQKALDHGATSVMPPADQDYGRSCGVNDAYGNTWWITSPL